MRLIITFHSIVCFSLSAATAILDYQEYCHTDRSDDVRNTIKRYQLNSFVHKYTLLLSRLKSSRVSQTTCDMYLHEFCRILYDGEKPRLKELLHDLITRMNKEELFPESSLSEPTWEDVPNRVKRYCRNIYVQLIAPSDRNYLNKHGRMLGGILNLNETEYGNILIYTMLHHQVSKKGIYKQELERIDGKFCFLLTNSRRAVDLKILQQLKDELTNILIAPNQQQSTVVSEVFSN
jgi:hypothetical protein